MFTRDSSRRTSAGMFRGSVLGAALLLALLLLVTAACAGGNDDETAAPTPQPAATTAPAPAAAPEPTAPAAPAMDEPRYGGIPIFTNRADPPGAFDPMRAGSSSLDWVIGSMSGDGNLIKFCREDIYKVCPGLAESWENSDDSAVWTFKIRDNVLWHDGTPFTAEDAKWWVDLSVDGAKVGGKIRAPSGHKIKFGAPEKVEVLSGNRLQITLGESAPLYLQVLGNPRNRLLHPRHLMQPLIAQGTLDVSPKDVAVVGTGPFKFLKHEKGTIVQVRRFDQYWEQDEAGRQLPFLDGIDFAIIRDPAAMAASFRAGQLDAGSPGTKMQLRPDQRAIYEKELGDEVWFAEYQHVLFSVSFNTLREGPQQDVNVRRAIALHMDKQAATEAVLGGKGLLYTILGPASPWGTPGFEQWPGFGQATKAADRAEAKRLMEAAGYPNGFSATMIARQDWEPRTEFVAGQMAGLGIDLKLSFSDPATYRQRGITGDWEVSWGGGGGTSTFPEELETTLARNSLNPASYMKHEDAKIDAFFERLKATTDFSERQRVYREMEQYILVDQVFAIPLVGEIGVIPFRSRVKGYIVPAAGIWNSNDFATVWLAEGE